MPRKSSTLDEAVMLIQILTRIPKGRLITAQQLKQELDAAGIPIRIRTLQRYLKTMASTDVFGIDCDMRSRPYGYKQSTAGGTLLSQQMSVHECLLLRLAQEHMRFMIPTTLSKSLSPLFDMASQKFNETLSAAPRNEKAWLKKIAVVGSSLPMMPPKISRTIFEAVSEALFRELKLEIEYDSASGKQVKSLITPLGLVQQDVRLYLVCMFDRYENVRHLALHRLTKARVTEFQAERPKDFSLDSYVNSCHFNYSDGSGRKVELSFRFTNAVTALNLNETPFNRTQRLEKLPDGSFHLSVILTDSPLIDGWIAVWKDKAGISELTRTPVTGSGIALAAEPPKYTRPGRVYNKNGAYEGRMDSSGRMYDQSGRYVGREDSSGRRYDASGRYQGRTDADGHRYDSSGRYQGHQDSSGRWYEQSGRYQGRESRDGSRYDSSGRYQGRTR